MSIKLLCNKIISNEILSYLSAYVLALMLIGFLLSILYSINYVFRHFEYSLNDLTPNYLSLESDPGEQ